MINVGIGELVSLSEFLDTELHLRPSIHLRDLAYRYGLQEAKLPDPELQITELGVLNSELTFVFGTKPYFYNASYFPLLPPEKQQEEMQRLQSMGAREANWRYGKLIFVLSPHSPMNEENLAASEFALYLHGPDKTLVNYGTLSTVEDEAHLHFKRYMDSNEPNLNKDGISLILPRDRTRLATVRIAIDTISPYLMKDVIEYRTHLTY